MADALGAAHAVGVLHRDVKPGNVLLERGGRVVLTDFGVATMEDPGDGSTSNLTQSGQPVGSLGYRETYGQWTNIWWAKTDDDHHTNVYVSDVYIRGGANDVPVPGLPTC